MKLLAETTLVGSFQPSPEDWDAMRASEQAAFGRIEGNGPLEDGLNDAVAFGVWPSEHVEPHKYISELDGETFDTTGFAVIDRLRKSSAHLIRLTMLSDLRIGSLGWGRVFEVDLEKERLKTYLEYGHVKRFGIDGVLSRQMAQSISLETIANSFKNRHRVDLPTTSDDVEVIKRQLELGSKHAATSIE